MSGQPQISGALRADTGIAMTVFVIAPDDGIQNTTSIYLRARGYRVMSFARADSLLATALQDDVLCLLLDPARVATDGERLLAAMRNRANPLPVIVTVEGGDIASAVEAMKAGASDVLEAPLDYPFLVNAVDQAAAEYAAKPRAIQPPHLTPRERSVFDLIVHGHSNKAAARVLGISPRTLETHRAHIMEKLSARSVSDLVRIACIDSSPRALQLPIVVKDGGRVMNTEKYSLPSSRYTAALLQNTGS